MGTKTKKEYEKDKKKCEAIIDENRYIISKHQGEIEELETQIRRYNNTLDDISDEIGRLKRELNERYDIKNAVNNLGERIYKYIKERNVNISSMKMIENSKFVISCVDNKAKSTQYQANALQNIDDTIITLKREIQILIDKIEEAKRRYRMYEEKISQCYEEIRTNNERIESCQSAIRRNKNNIYECDRQIKRL